MVAARLEETEGRTGYPQLPYHRVVTIGTAWLDPGTGRFKLGVLGGEAMDERSHLEGFFALFRRQPEPRLVSWNGSGFDVPVIRYRAVKHGIPAPELYRTEGDWKWSNYQNRYHDPRLGGACGRGRGGAGSVLRGTIREGLEEEGRGLWRELAGELEGWPRWAT
jgi:predicted PolB exonuclease-like 3'-5' exonuclease